jgi:DNA polymerase-3 subunit epsilon
MESVLLEIYKTRIEIILNIYYKDIINYTQLNENEKNYDYLKLLCPTDDEQLQFNTFFNNNLLNETTNFLEKKVTTFRLLDSLPGYDNITFGEIIRKAIELDNQINTKKSETEINQIIENKSILFFDTETTGLPKNYKAPYSDTNNWPRLVQLAYILCDSKGEIIDKGSWIVKPYNFVIPNEASKIHRISNERALAEGLPLNIVMHNFNSILNQTNCLVAHNISFDVNIIGAEFTRLCMTSKLDSIKKICTMESTTNYCAIEGTYGFKWPKLAELYFKLFNTNFEEAHDATIDIEATYRCFWELSNKKIINL